MIKFLADVNVEKMIIDFLKQEGFDVIWAPDYDCKMTDDALVKLANDEKRVLLTNDKDFGEIVFQQKRVSTGIILFRIRGQNVNEKIAALSKLIRYYHDQIKHHFIVITRRKVRIRRLEKTK